MAKIKFKLLPPFQSPKSNLFAKKIVSLLNKIATTIRDLHRKNLTVDKLNNVSKLTGYFRTPE